MLNSAQSPHTHTDRGTPCAVEQRAAGRVKAVEAKQQMISTSEKLPKGCRAYGGCDNGAMAKQGESQWL
ncbi:hypothetical protein GOP47_0019747 [Adiantum capillus-veneris]|uniref:Uncharacterized protein n=1 Tax=Adiantum capillus-veneris TaxID=13818 RepID=A0A9D4UCC9_ADICA|nr:hypothetical protein GOP47_0019747 [Adiantum capillus-veneris]